MKYMNSNIQYISRDIAAGHSIHFSISPCYLGHFGWTTGGQAKARLSWTDGRSFTIAEK